MSRRKNITKKELDKSARDALGRGASVTVSRTYGNDNYTAFVVFRAKDEDEARSTVKRMLDDMTAVETEIPF